MSNEYAFCRVAGKLVNPFLPQIAQHYQNTRERLAPSGKGGVTYIKKCKEVGISTLEEQL